MDATIAVIRLVMIGFTPKDAIRLMEEAGFHPRDPKRNEIVSKERLRLEIEEWSVRKTETKKETK